MSKINMDPGAIFGSALAALIMFAGQSLLVMLLWNACVPAVFGGPHVSFYSAAALTALYRVVRYDG